MDSSADAPAPGTLVKTLLDERGWSQLELAQIMGRSAMDISDIVLGKRVVSPEIAKELSVAFGNTAEYWLDLESRYRLMLSKDPDDAVMRRAKLYRFAPIKEMIKRGWVEAADGVEAMESAIKRFYGVANLDEPINLPHAARRGTQDISQAEWAWLFRARHLAAATHADPFSAQSFNLGVAGLRELLPSTQETRRASTVLASAGIRLLIIEHLPKTRIDGATFWLDRKSPVIALSLRYDRIDCFWFTLAHELGHIAHRDAWSFDPDLVGDRASISEDESEARANRFATNFLVQEGELDSFISRTRPLYGQQRIVGFAARMHVHPGIVVGQLQFRKEIGWDSCRSLLEKVRDVITQSTLTDGWGQLPPALE